MAAPKPSNPLPGYIHITPGGGGKGSSEAAFLGPKYNPLYLGNGRAPANTAPDPAISALGASGRQALRMHANDRFARRRRTAETEAYTHHLRSSPEADVPPRGL